MDKDVKQQWITALRSGQYSQCQGELKDNEGANCCLGVLLESQGWEFSASIRNPHTDVCYYTSPEGFCNDEENELTVHTRDEFSLTRKQEVHLMNMNDKEDKDFIQIADWIEDHL